MAAFGSFITSFSAQVMTDLSPMIRFDCETRGIEKKRTRSCVPLAGFLRPPLLSAAAWGGFYRRSAT